MNLQFFTWLEVQSLCLSTSVGGQNGGEATDFVLHPLIHTLLEFTLAQMFIVVKAGGVEAGTMIQKSITRKMVAKWWQKISSLEGRCGKENPHRPSVDKSRWGPCKGNIGTSEPPHSRHGLTHANPMPKKSPY